MQKRSTLSFIGSLCCACFLAGQLHAAEDAWWNPAWTQRQMLTLNTGSDGAAIAEAAAGATVLVRLTDSNFQFGSAREDGSDLRFVAADGKTLLPHQIESYDGVLNEAFIWVGLPEVTPASKASIYVYFGNTDGAMPAAAKPADAYDADTTLVYHFGGRGSAPVDATANGNKADNAGATAEASLIGSGLKLAGATPLTIPNSTTLAWKQDQPLTLSLWIKPAALQANAVVLSRGNGSSALRLLLDQGLPVVEVTPAGAPLRGQPAAPVAAGAWSHLALVADGKSLRLFLNGVLCGSADGGLPAFDAPLLLGGLATAAAGTSGFSGELDEFTVSRVARSAAWIKLAAVNQANNDVAQRTLSLGQMEGDAAKAQSKFMEHLSLFKDIAANMMFDGWIAVGICVLMIVVGWSVAIRKFIYLNAIEKGTRVFLKQWKHLSTDLTALNPDDTSSVNSLGGQMSAGDLALIAKSPLLHIYQIGSEEIRHRLEHKHNRIHGLTGRSIQAIRASLDAGLVHETHRLSDGLIYLTISIAGGPYVGLLGTVVGVMITFAIIARSGEVNVNSIAPGIASALLATVFGLVVAIPALFIYSYLNGRIKNSLSLMQVFIDEFVAKMAEFYRPPQEPDPSTDKSL
jgi:biopolymer transport protein ExbB